MRKQIVKGSEEWNMFGDFFKLYQEFGNPEQTDQYWKNAMQAFIDFGMKYDEASNGLSSDMASMLLMFLNRLTQTT